MEVDRHIRAAYRLPSPPPIRYRPTVPDVQPTPTDNDSLVDQTTTDGTISAPTTDVETQIPADNPTVADDEGATAVINFELQEVQADYKWKTVTFSQPFVDPVVVAGPPSFNDAKPATLRTTQRHLDRLRDSCR